MKSESVQALFEELDDDIPAMTFEKIVKSTGRGKPGEAATSRHRQPRNNVVPKKSSTSNAEFIHSQEIGRAHV